jgi:hypothetical protein
MAAARRWGVGSGKFTYPSTFGHVSTCVYMSYRPNKFLCPWYTFGGKMSDMNLEQQINLQFCVKTGKSASETLALLILVMVNML